MSHVSPHFTLCHMCHIMSHVSLLVTHVTSCHMCHLISHVSPHVICHLMSPVQHIETVSPNLISCHPCVPGSLWLITSVPCVTSVTSCHQCHLLSPMSPRVTSVINMSSVILFQPVPAAPHKMVRHMQMSSFFFLQ